MTTRLFIGTDKGLFRAKRARAGQWRVDGPSMAGYTINHVHVSAATPGLLYATANHRVWGAALHRSEDGGDSWTALAAVPRHPAGRHGSSLNSIWYVTEAAHGAVLYAGIDPAGLFSSQDGGASWTDIVALNEHPTRNTWEPSRGIFAVHSINADAADPARIYLAISAGGAYRTGDAGATWQPINSGVRAANLPDAFPSSGHNVHRLIAHPAQSGRLYRQCYTGTYRSDDMGETWRDITDGLPSDFGYAIAADPHDPDVVFQIPLTGTHLRAPPNGTLQVFRSSNAGADWIASATGLPDENVWVSVLRQALTTGMRQPCDVYFGTTGGHVFASDNAGASWSLIAEYLARILSIAAAP